MTRLQLILLAGALSCSLASTPVAARPTAAASQSQATLVMQAVDTAPGSGKLAAQGNTVSVHYSGWLFSPKANDQRGAQIDSSKGVAPFTFQLGRAKVIKGLDEGIVGMRVGGKRTLIVPAEMGYGSRGAGPIPPNANLIFDIELLDVK